MGIMGWDVNDTQRGHKKGISVGGFGKRNLGHGVNAYVNCNAFSANLCSLFWFVLFVHCFKMFLLMC